jgi:hypothetical protein
MNRSMLCPITVTSWARSGQPGSLPSAGIAAVFYHLDHTFKVFFSQLRSGWQAEPAIEKVFAHRSSPNPTAFEYGLQGHGLPGELGCFDID